jgi:predicted lysophospholipase L1 biosynthesis ABC-type transport system permease subunit
MIKKILWLDWLFIFSATLLLLLSAAKYYSESQARLSLGADVVISSSSRKTDMLMEIFTAVSTVEKSVARLRETTVRAKETDERPNSRPMQVTLLAIDASYPIYGTLDVSQKIRPDTLSSTGKGDSHGALVSASLIRDLSISPGDMLTLGTSSLMVTGILNTDPKILPLVSNLPVIIVSDRTYDYLVKEGVLFITPQMTHHMVRLNPSVDRAMWQNIQQRAFSANDTTAISWWDYVPRHLLMIKMPFLLITAGILLLILIVRFERRKNA